VTLFDYLADAFSAVVDAALDAIDLLPSPLDVVALGVLVLSLVSLAAVVAWSVVVAGFLGAFWVLGVTS